MNAQPRMTWAQMAHAEGHRKGFPASPCDVTPVVSEREQVVVDYLSKNPGSSVRQVRIALGMADHEAKRLIGRARNRGIVGFSVVAGHGGKFRRYHIKEAVQ